MLAVVTNTKGLNILKAQQLLLTVKAAEHDPNTVALQG